jgi:putative iron-dependent peroxidase
MTATGTPQPGIFALGTTSHTYLELDATSDSDPQAVVTAIATVCAAATTLRGVDVVAGLRPELWASISPDGGVPDATSFSTDIVGPDGFTMPATQHDLVLWISGAGPDAVYDTTGAASAILAPVATLADETIGWSYHGHFDLTGFIDGTENPPLFGAARVAVVPEGRPGAGASILLLQKWEHDGVAWTSLPVAEQEQVIGRTKLDSIELDPRPTTSHAARTDQDEFGHILRRNVAYGSSSRHGTMFVGFCGEQRPLRAMLESMAGVGGGERDALTRYTRPLTGAYYVIPSVEALTVFAPTEQ